MDIKALKTKEVFTTYEIGKFCHVHQTTVINWIKSARLRSYATPGGHRRVKREDLITFLKKTRLPVPGGFETDIRRRILVVDDDTQALKELKALVAGREYDTDVASSGFEAGRKIYKKKPDLILLDFRMPGMNGFEVCEALKRDPETADIPIIAVTVLSSPADIKRITKCGVWAHVPKPVDPAVLLKEIDAALAPAGRSTLAASVGR